MEKFKQMPVEVMVLGPGKGGGKKYQKRCQIRDKLNEMEGVHAFFAEDPEIADPIVADLQLDPEDPVPLEDFLVQEADAIIALEMSPGVTDEVARYARKRLVGHKIFELLPAKYEKEKDTSFAGKLRRKLDQRYFTPTEFKTCDIAKRICPEHVRGVQAAKIFESD